MELTNHTSDDDMRSYWKNQIVSFTYTKSFFFIYIYIKALLCIVSLKKVAFIYIFLAIEKLLSLDF